MEWTKDQRDLLFSDKTNEEIAAEMGRSLQSVKKARYYYTGHTVNPEKTLLNGEQRISAIEAEARILDLAKRMHIKIGGAYHA